MTLFRRKSKQPAPLELPAVRSPALDAVLEHLARVSRETNERVDQLIERLNKRLSEETQP